MVHGFFDWLARWHVGDFAGIAGLVVSIAGFAITIWQIRRAKSVSEQIRSSVIGVRQELERKNIAVDLGQLIRELEEIKQLHRLNIPQILPGRYTSVRRKLVEMRGSSILLPKQRAVLQESISQLTDFETFCDSSPTGQQTDLKALNPPVNREIDKLIELLVMVQNKERRKQ